MASKDEELTQTTDLLGVLGIRGIMSPDLDIERCQVSIIKSKFSWL